ncbi:hypothetical protein A3715_15315 [Oleiphilus sp. HI0009]|uniref:Dph6-related ATP pyrophosphatase n=1 Tax=unclassified Oleiphilus TaxID=2631174 RepID=UPI0007C26794|nr:MULTISPECIES: hypothetical protein [unclassified Oleiphilus]KZX74604.1 hypothetical protein A3715_15315 [Oleiphilus sp. HI0009]
MKRVIISWSSGKDSALTMQRMIESTEYEVVGLVTTYSESKSLVPIQATPIEYVRLQAQAMELPLLEIKMADQVSNEVYKNTLLEGLANWTVPFDAIAFGDLYCNGIVEFRQKLFSETVIECVFPLLIEEQIDLSREIARQIINTPIRALLQSINLKHLEEHCCGADYDNSLLEGLPECVDPCGEVGEFHTFVYDAPFFKTAIRIHRTEQERQTYHHGREMNMLVQKFEASLP